MTRTKAVKAYIEYLADTVRDAEERARISEVVRKWETYKINNNECMKELTTSIERR